MAKQNRFLHRMLPVLLLVTLVGCAGEESQPTEVEQVERTLTIISVEGMVQVRAMPDAEPIAASPNQILSVGNELITGADGQVVIEMDDGTTMIITEESSFVVQALEGTPESPISRFFLNLGQVFAFHEGELPDDAAFEVETPNGVAAIRGSMVQVMYDPITGQVIVTCVTGHCSLTAGGVTVDLTEGQWVEVEGFDLPPGEIFVMDDSQLQAWIDAAGASGVTLHLPDTTSTLPEVTPEVTEEPDEPECLCDGPDLVCDDGTTTEDHADCLANCICDGPDFVCDGVTVAEEDEDCLLACECESYDLVCEDGVVIEGHEECGGCLCEGYDLVCNGELVVANSAECGWVCDPALTCGNGACDAECENSDLCLEDCPCADDGVCSPGEGFGCRDCIGPGENSASACGSPCQDSCEGELSCEDGVCWDPCTCGGSCGDDDDCPVVCECVGLNWQQCTDCHGNTWGEPGDCSEQQ